MNYEPNIPAQDEPEGVDECPVNAEADNLNAAGIHTEYPCNPRSYTKGRKSKTAYLVIHYVGATGSAKANASYFHAPGANAPQASAHYFVGHAREGAAIYSSVPEQDTAWHCGSSKGYKHSECRNFNSIGIELCCHKDGSGNWYFDRETVAAAQKLCRSLIAQYGIPIQHVLRHYDVTGKCCPEPFVRDEAAWKAFLKGLQ